MSAPRTAGAGGVADLAGSGVGHAGGVNSSDQCAVCGRPRPDGAARALEGSTTHDGDQISWTCARCTREHARSMEARLDDRWW